MLRDDIGINAGIIWNLLYEKGELSIMELCELTNYREDMISLALGWLAREDKIRFFEAENALCVELNNGFNELYY